MNEEVCRLASIGIWLRDVLIQVDPGNAGYTLHPAEPGPMALLASQRKPRLAMQRIGEYTDNGPDHLKSYIQKGFAPRRKKGGCPPSFCKNNRSPSIFAIVFQIITSIPMVLPFSFHAV